MLHIRKVKLGGKVNDIHGYHDVNVFTRKRAWLRWSRNYNQIEQERKLFIVHWAECLQVTNHGSSPSEVFLRKDVLKICSKFTGEHQCRSGVSINLLCNFTVIALLHGCSSVNLLHIFRTPFLKNTSGWLLLSVNKSKQSTLTKKYFLQINGSIRLKGSYWHERHCQ